MTKEHTTDQIWAIKYPFKVFVGVFFVIFGIFFVLSNAGAIIPFSDDFNSYNDGDLYNQNGWLGSYPYWQIQGIKTYEGTKAIKCSSASCRNWKFGEPVEAGLWEMDFIVTDCQGTTMFILRQADFIKIQTQIWVNAGKCEVWAETNTGWQSIFSSNDLTIFNDWKTFFIEWKSDNQFRIRYDGVAFSDWILNPRAFTSITGLDLLVSSSTKSKYVDFIRETIGYEPKLTPEKPIDCQSNTVDYSNVEIKGKIEIPVENPNTYDTLIATFEEVGGTSTSRYVYIDLPDLVGRDSFNYDTATTLPPATGYRVFYQILGYDTTGKRISFYHYCPETYVSQTYPLPPETIEQIGFYETPVLDECGGLSGPDKWLCEIKNLFQGLFVPSQAKVNELKQNVELIKQKFPMNYLNVGSNFYSDVKNGVNPTATIPFKILGKSGNVDFSFWGTPVVLAGISQSFSGIFKGFFSFVFLAGFMTWAISFGKRIFK